MAAEPPTQPAVQPASPPAAAATDTTASGAKTDASTTAQQGTTPAATKPAAAADAAGAPKKNVVVLVDNTLNDEQLKQILAKGYRPEKRGDQTLYCRREAELGSHFEKKTCRSAIRIMEDETQGKDATAYAQRVGPAQMGH